MNLQTKCSRGTFNFDEMKEFARLSTATQRYIRRSLEVGRGERDVVHRWARNSAEAASIRGQEVVYRRLDDIRRAASDCHDLVPPESLMGPLITITTYDLVQGRIDSFHAYRFLYERLIGASVRPWLPAAFCAAATLPRLHPADRRDLLRTVDEATAALPGWSIREATFVPEWVDKVDATT